MKKCDELTDLKSCLNRTAFDELLFVLRQRDRAVPATIRAWIAERIRLGLNESGDAKLVEAEKLAAAMAEQWIGVPS